MEADYSDDNHTQGNLCPSAATATYADLPPPSTRGQSQSPGSSGVPFASYTLILYHSNQVLAARNRVNLQHGSLSFDAIYEQSTSIPVLIPDDFDSQLSKKQSSGSIISNEFSPDNNLMTISVGDGIFDCEVGDRPPKRSRTELGGHYLEHSNHEIAVSPSVVPESEDFGSKTGDSGPESESDAENLQDLGDRWEYRRIVARRINSSGRRMAQVEWKNTWEPEDELNGLKSALRRYAKERRGIQSPAKECPNCDSDSASDTDADDHSSEDRWEYRRIVSRRIDPSGRRMAMVEWKNTWEPEDELGGLEKALRRYARERWAKQGSMETCSKCGPKKRKYPA
ncbi:hypothetical protein ZTR_10657 [Talaromyces verruculosus]|nr:hypothetical protein ZTR_10657 [Talaromyces verruculosus]